MLNCRNSSDDHLDRLGIGVVVGLPVPDECVANALVDCVNRGFIGHGEIDSEERAVPVRMTGNDQKRSLANGGSRVGLAMAKDGRCRHQHRILSSVRF